MARREVGELPLLPAFPKQTYLVGRYEIFFFTDYLWRKSGTHCCLLTIHK